MQNIDTERFIREVEKRPVIWDYTSVNPGDRLLRAKAWEEMCCIFDKRFNSMNPDQKSRLCTNMQRKWKSYRDSFRRELAKSKQEPAGSSTRREYIYYKNLAFLLPVCEEKPNKKNVDIDVEVNTADDNLTEQVTFITRKKKKTRSCEQIVPKKTAKYEPPTEKEDADKLFLLSLLPHFKSIPEDGKLKVQEEFIKVLRKTKKEYYGFNALQFSSTNIFPGGPSSINPLVYSFPNSTDASAKSSSNGHHYTRPTDATAFSEVTAEKSETASPDVSQASSPRSETSSICDNLFSP